MSLVVLVPKFEMPNKKFVRDAAANQLLEYAEKHEVRFFDNVLIVICLIMCDQSKNNPNVNIHFQGDKKSITTNTGNPVGYKNASLTVGYHGPTLLQDVSLLDDLSHFTKERNPERVVHAKGAGAFGYFEVTHDITLYTAAKPFSEIGKKTPIAMR